MVTNYYNASNNYKSPIRREPKPYEEKCDNPPLTPLRKDVNDNDNLLILGLLAVLYITNCDDKWLMLALLYLAFS